MSDFRDTWRVLCHGGGDKTEGTETIGMAFSTCADKPRHSCRLPVLLLYRTLLASLALIRLVGVARCRDLLHWTAGPGPAATSMMHYADGSTRKFGKRER